jgi:hypothetical protein
MTDTRAQTFAEWWNGSDASGRGRLAASDGSFYGIAQDAWLAAWSARDEEIAAKDAEIERLRKELATERAAWRFVPDDNGGHMLSVPTGDKWYPESWAQKRIDGLEGLLREIGNDPHASITISASERIAALLSTEGE